MVRMRRTVGLIVGSALFLVSVSALAQSGEFPWDRAVGVEADSLDQETRERVLSLAESIPNYHGCRGTVRECVEAETPDATAQRLLGFLARRVVAGDATPAIEEQVADRRRSARPLITAEIDLLDASCMGAEPPLVTIVEFAEFSCPFCRTSSPLLEQLVRERPDHVRFCYKFFPIRTHERGVPSCVAALAAARQGRFWEMHDALYASAPDLADEDLLRCAEEAQLDIERFRADYENPDLVEEVMTDKFEGQELGVDRTPTIFINGKQYYGEISEIELADRIDEELEFIQ